MILLLFAAIIPISFVTANKWSFYEQNEGQPLGSLLTQLISLHHQRRPMRCVSLMTDPHYSNRFSAAKLNEDAPLILDEIQFEHTSLRNSTIFAALKKVTAADCGMIALFFRNEQKLARALRISDRKRLIKSKARLILPFDVRLFYPKMHNFWRRFLNVIFLRDLSRNPKRRDGLAQNRSAAIPDASVQKCFELSTVSFPAPVDPDHPETWLPPPIATWCPGRYYGKRRNLFFAKNKNLDGQVLRAVYFELSPAVIKAEQKSGGNLQGVEIGILGLMSKILNFSPLLMEISNMSSGAIAALTSGSTDVALGNFAYVSSTEKSTDLSAPYATYCYTFITPELIGDVSWRALLLPFDRDLWAAAALALVFGWLSMHLTARLQKKERGNELRLLLPSALSTLSMQLMVPLPRAPQGWPLRLLFCSFWLHCLLLSVSYRASFASQLAKPPPRIAIDTVDKLAETKYLRLITYDNFAAEIFNSSLDKSGAIVAERMETVLMDPAEIVSLIKLGKVAFFGNVYLLNSLKTLSEKMEVGKYSVHVNEECVISLPVSIGLARNSALTPQVDKIVKRAVENGLVTKWLQESEYKSVPSTGAQQAVVDLPKMISIFAALSSGLCVSLIAFVGEIIFARVKKRKINA
ncbi:Hypothetical predicted protein [Cloeon dipterum]|uniref:Ionotropic glutamate receptor C-terminal domain-containing protein n=1 Tax=Cloeon dipterum TaxID=197152 RepID=A0A8S1CR73_9INSE|nr:Hypothetical predicted protein [Cloeon dipterum]